MAVNEVTVTGRKFRKLVDEATKLWQRISFWTKASDVEFDDGKTAETKFGAINGVTDSLTSTSSNVAASAAAVKALNDKITQLSSNIRPEAVLYDNSSVSGQVESSYGSSSAKLEYTFTRDYANVMVFASGGRIWYNLDSNAPGIVVNQNATVTCTNGTVVNKNGYFLIKNVKSGSKITASISNMVGGYYHKSFLRLTIVA